jgi:steroid delta-isomerase-like uncharacterized protein
MLNGKIQLLMSFKKNKQLILQFYEEVWGEGDLEFAKEVFNEDYVRHDLRQGYPVAGPAGQMQIAENFRSAFPDVQIQIDLVFGDDEYIAARWTMTGTHTGQWNDIQPTNKKVSFSGVNLFRFENGKVAEIWNHRDDLGLMQQLGAEVYAGQTNK